MGAMREARCASAIPLQVELPPEADGEPLVRPLVGDVVALDPPELADRVLDERADRDLLARLVVGAELEVHVLPTVARLVGRGALDLEPLPSGADTDPRRQRHRLQLVQRIGGLDADPPAARGAVGVDGVAGVVQRVAEEAEAVRGVDAGGQVREEPVHGVHLDRDLVVHRVRQLGVLDRVAHREAEAGANAEVDLRARRRRDEDGDQASEQEQLAHLDTPSGYTHTLREQGATATLTMATRVVCRPRSSRIGVVATRVRAVRGRAGGAPDPGRLPADRAGEAQKKRPPRGAAASFMRPTRGLQVELARDAEAEPLVQRLVGDVTRHAVDLRLAVLRDGELDVRADRELLVHLVVAAGLEVQLVAAEGRLEVLDLGRALLVAEADARPRNERGLHLVERVERLGADADVARAAGRAGRADVGGELADAVREVEADRDVLVELVPSVELERDLRLDSVGHRAVLDGVAHRGSVAEARADLELRVRGRRDEKSDEGAENEELTHLVHSLFG